MHKPIKSVCETISKTQFDLVIITAINYDISILKIVYWVKYYF